VEVGLNGEKGLGLESGVPDSDSSLVLIPVSFPPKGLKGANAMGALASLLSVVEGGLKGVNGLLLASTVPDCDSSLVFVCVSFPPSGMKGANGLGALVSLLSAVNDGFKDENGLAFESSVLDRDLSLSVVEVGLIDENGLGLESDVPD
jgi:hypothetical protein